MAYQFMIKKKRDSITKQFKKDAFIYLRYSYKETECLIATGRKIEVKYWDEENEEPKRGYPGNKNSLVKLLTKIQGDVENAESELTRDGHEVTADEVKKRYIENSSGIATGPIKAVTLWENFINEGVGRKDPKSIRNERGSLNAFKKFCEEKKKGVITLRKINKELITAFETWLSVKAHNTKVKRLKDLKAFLIHVKHPAIELIKYKEVQGDKVFLTEPELIAFELLDLNESLVLSQVRDLILLQCNTGLRVSDILRLGPEHIQGNDLLIRAKKNDSIIRMPISSRIAEIIKKYNGKLPVVDYYTYNNSIEEVAKLAIPKSKVEVTEHRNGTKTKKTCFKWEVLTSHDFVRTYINLAAARGMSMPSIAALTGKTVATLLKSYLNPSAEQAYLDAKQFDRPVMVVNG